MQEELKTPPYDWDKRLPEIKEAGKRLKQYEDANLDMFERFDIGVKEKCYQEGATSVQDFAKAFFKQEIENLFENIEQDIEKIEIDNELAFYKDEHSSPVIAVSEVYKVLIKIAAKHGFKI